MHLLKYRQEFISVLSFVCESLTEIGRELIMISFFLSRNLDCDTKCKYNKITDLTDLAS